MTIIGLLARVASVAILVAGVAACGGGGHTVPSTGTVSPAGSARGSASFTITVPAAASASSVRRKQYISSATASVRIDVKASGSEVAGFPVTVAVTPGSPNCTAGSGGTTCTLSVNVLAGSYTASVTALDANGNAISTAVAVPFTIAPGTVTTVPLVLDGIIATIGITPTASSAPTFVSGSATAGFGLIGQGSRSFTISAVDTNGNTIVGAGAPTFTIVQSGPITLTLGQPTTNAPNTFTLTPPAAWFAGSDTVTVNASYADGTSCASTGGACSASVHVAMRELLLINNHVSGTSLTLIPDGDAAPIAQITTGVVSPSPVWGSPTGDIVSGNSPGYLGNLLSTLTLFAFPYQSGPYAVLTTSAVVGNSIPWTAQFDPFGNLLVTDYFGNTIRAFAPPFSTPPSAPSTPFATITGLHSPGSFEIDRTGTLFVGNSATQTVTEYAPKTFAGPVVAPIAPPFVTGPNFCCMNLASSPAGELAITSTSEPTVWIYSPPYTGAPVATIAVGATNSGVHFTADDTLFISTPTGGLVVAPPYNGTPVVFTPATPTNACTIDDADAIICIETNNTVLDVFPPPYATTPAVRVTSGINGSGPAVVIP
jgi:hypothetical protein